jgi:hypothetical protein
MRLFFYRVGFAIEGVMIQAQKGEPEMSSQNETGIFDSTAGLHPAMLLLLTARTCMRHNGLFLFFLLFILTGCSDPADPCSVTANIVPATASADHSATAPGNQVQFSLVNQVTGSCPFIADIVGTWSTSDPSHASIINEGATKGLATCLGSSATPITVNNSSTVRGRKYSPATLVCN